MDEMELIQQAFLGELTAEEIGLLRSALERRLEAVRLAHACGEASDEMLRELEDVYAHLSILKEEEAISSFVDRAVRSTVRRRKLLADLGEAEDES